VLELEPPNYRLIAGPSQQRGWSASLRAADSKTYSSQFGIGPLREVLLLRKRGRSPTHELLVDEVLDWLYFGPQQSIHDIAEGHVEFGRHLEEFSVLEEARI